jgi:Holliday junction resolvase RusA-like endonuclease
VFVSSFTIPGNPVGKPRQTQADKWQRRPVVEKYREWADSARVACRGDPQLKIAEPVFGIIVFCHFQIPDSWSKHRKSIHYGKVHSSDPDADNVLKSAMDALFEDDKKICVAQAFKLWCEEGAEPRTDVFLLSLPNDAAECVSLDQEAS